MADISNASSMAIFSAPTAVPAGRIEIRATWKSSEKKGRTVEATRAHRSIHVQEWDLSAVPSKFDAIVRQALVRVAVSVLESACDTLDGSGANMVREIAPALFTVDALLAHATRKAESTRLSAESIGAWFDASALAAWIKGTKGDAAARILKVYRDLLATCTTIDRVKALTQQNADNLKAALLKPEAAPDVENPIGEKLLELLIRAEDERAVAAGAEAL